MLGLRRNGRLGRALALGLALAACGGARRERAFADAAPQEVLVEVLPRSAQVRLDGRPLGAGSRAVTAPPPGEHVLAVAADGYEPVERALAEEDLAGARVAAALRPSGFGAARPVDYDDAEVLALAAAFLVRSGAARDAADYAERAVVLDPRLAAAHRVLGDALHGLGDRRRAASEWSESLRLDPEAPDAALVRERIEAARGGVRAP